MYTNIYSPSYALVTRNYVVKGRGTGEHKMETLDIFA